MSSKSNPSTEPKKYKPMPMKTLLASIKALPDELNNRDSSDSSCDESDGYVKKLKVPSIYTRNKSRDRSYFNRVHIMPTIEGTNSSSLPVAVEKATRPPLLQKDSSRCLFPEPIKEKAKEPSVKPAKEPVKEPPVQAVRPEDTQMPSLSSINEKICECSRGTHNTEAPNMPQPPVEAVQPVNTRKSSLLSIIDQTYACHRGTHNGQAPNVPQPPADTQKPSSSTINETTHACHKGTHNGQAPNIPQPPIQAVQLEDAQKPSSSSIIDQTYGCHINEKISECHRGTHNVQAPNMPQPPVQAVQPVNTQKPSSSSIIDQSYACHKGTHNAQAPNVPQPPVDTQKPSSSSINDKTDCHRGTNNGQAPNVPATPLQSTRNTTVQYKSISIKGKKYMYIKKLGSGGSSSVYKMLEVSTTNEYALKTVKLTGDREMQQGYLNEVKVLRNLQSSDRVIKLYEFEHVKSAKVLNLLLEQGETDLATFLSKHSDGAPPALVLHYWEEMLKAVQQIHAHGIVHADLKPSNFLLVSGHLKLIDFGIASKVSSDATSVERSCGRGTFSYISPEALGGDGSQPIKVSFYSDVWSLGCILYGLIYGHTPFSHLSNMVKIVAIRDSNHHIVYPRADHVPASLLALVKQCLQYNGHSRPTVTQLLQINHLVLKRQLIPKEILDKLQACLTAQEFNLLQSAEVPAEAMN